MEGNLVSNLWTTATDVALRRHPKETRRKLPFSAQIGLINGPSLLTNLLLLPAVVLGIVIGWRTVKVMSQRVFEWVVFAFALVAALRLVW